MTPGPGCTIIRSLVMTYRHNAGMKALDRKSPVPLYYQLKEIFRSWITSGKFDSDGRFPSESEPVWR